MGWVFLGIIQIAQHFFRGVVGQVARVQLGGEMGALQNLQCVRVAGSVDLIFDRDDVDVIGVVPIDRVGGVSFAFMSVMR